MCVTSLEKTCNPLNTPNQMSGKRRKKEIYQRLIVVADGLKGIHGFLILIRCTFGHLLQLVEMSLNFSFKIFDAESEVNLYGLMNIVINSAHCVVYA